MIGIIGAMQLEIDALKSAMLLKCKKTIAGADYFCGELHGQSIIVVCCGIGKVNAALTASFLLANFDTCAIISLGIAGGIGESMGVGDIVISKNCVQYDYCADLTSVSNAGVLDRVGSAFIKSDLEIVNSLANVIKGLGHNYCIGNIATGDKFVADKSFAKIVAKTYDAIAIEMESAAIAHVCFLCNIPFVSLRTISDSCDDSAEFDFAQNMIYTAKRSCTIISEWLKAKQLTKSL
ncbi:MAG: 5'-methylthioadenosine/adenosylhomocysteine nucleosidase [Clostridiales bacterium]|jgi:adenosylhomocysteine nucleosidase|nr:5'-methylthioadenosine/adenosylhomocysteine nucleosidase [Clostridiales bacterium]